MRLRGLKKKSFKKRGADFVFVWFPGPEQPAEAFDQLCPRDAVYEGQPRSASMW